jgi:hypothetical protein
LPLSVITVNLVDCLLNPRPGVFELPSKPFNRFGKLLDGNGHHRDGKNNKPRPSWRDYATTPSHFVTFASIVK